MDAAPREESDASSYVERESQCDSLRQDALIAAKACLEQARAAESPAGGYARSEDLERVRKCFSTFARALREAGATPESMVVQVKELIEKAGPDSVARTALAQHGVSWAIRAYYIDD